MKKKSGVLLHISSLPSKYGIGAFGKEAYKFVDFLKKSGQSYWQILPLGPTGYGDSPYSSFSAFAGNPYFIDLDLLCEEGLLSRNEYTNIKWSDKDNKVNYSRLFKHRYEVLRIAYSRFKFDSSFNSFVKKNNDWLYDYSIFMSLKTKFNNSCWLDWPKAFRLKDNNAIKSYIDDNLSDIRFWQFIQYKFYSQFNLLKIYANKNGIKIFGDCPIYVSIDSADVWSNREIFVLNKEGLPKSVAGVPPDYFSKNGQLWGNPLYDWQALKKTNYDWWISRLKHYEKMYDVLRIDHFIGFESYYAVKYGSKNAKNGKMLKGPGYDFIKVVNNKLKRLKIVAEDLGTVTDDVRILLKKSGYPGMRVMRFGYDGKTDNDNRVENYPINCVAYLTSHDTDTCIEWYKSCTKNQKLLINESIQIDKKNINWSLIDKLLSSNSYLVIIQAQDILGLGKGNRMNEPGKDKNNWQWRLLPNSLNDKLTNELFKITQINKRI